MKIIDLSNPKYFHFNRSKLYEGLKALKALKSERGSALVEFLILGLPLFLPLIIFLGNIYDSSSSQFDLENYSRQLARAFVTSPSNQVAVERIGLIEREFKNSLFGKDKFASLPIVDIKCSQNPCLTNGGFVDVVVTAKKVGSEVTYESRTRETVDRWRD